MFDIIAMAISFLLGLGIVWKKLRAAKKAYDETKELLELICQSLADQRLTKDEIVKIIKEAKDIPPAIKGLFK